MGLSRRHHFIPQFLIKQFSDADGLMYIYDKQKKQFWKDRKGPKSIFFEFNRNIVELNGEPSDSLERLYADLDSYMAKPFVDLLTTKNLSPENVFAIQSLITTLKWRLPANDADFERLAQELDYEDLPFKIHLKGTSKEEETEALNHLKQSSVFKVMKRVILPFLPFYEGMYLAEEKALTNYNSSYLHSNNQVISILGDSPIIEGDNSDVHNIGKIILPLSNSDTFICSPGSDKRISNSLFYLNKDLAVFHQSHQFVVCKDRRHLENIIAMYNQLEEAGMASQSVRQIFNFV